jgi:prepilin-type N-terminal cleavage/methylation domain-containing protein
MRPENLKKPAAQDRKSFPMPGRSPLRGFTLLELLLVLVLLSLCAATTVRWYFSNAEVTLENAAILLARDLRAAQHRSIFLSEPGRFQFLAGGEGYAVTDSLGTLALNPTTDLPFVRVYGDDGVFAGVHVKDALAGGDRTLEIDKRGLPLEDLSVTLTFENDERRVQLDRVSGVITIVGSTSGWLDDEL